ncbi:MAG: hypothetical protein AAF092_03225 [Pseudomonadota bacterium]
MDHWRVYGLPRSGNHAIIDWLCRNLGHEHTVFLNNCATGDPFKSFGYCNYAHDGHWRKHRADIRAKGNRHMERLIAARDRAEHLVVSYETIDPTPEELSATPTGLDPARHRGDVLILRSPLNRIASFIQRTRKEVTRPHRRAAFMADLQTEMTTRYATHLTAAQSGAVQPVIYDDWGASERYRADVLDTLAIPARDTTLGTMTTAGGGSSFGQGEPLADISRSRRWERFTEDPDFITMTRALKAAPRVMALVEAVFPEDAARLGEA